MYTLTLLAQKGGTGKTTLAINLSIAAEAAGWRAALVDLDPQASAAGWGDHRGKERPAVAACAFGCGMGTFVALEAAKLSGRSPGCSVDALALSCAAPPPRLAP